MDTFQRKWHISSCRSPILMLQVALEILKQAAKIISYDQIVNQCARSSKSAYKLQVAAKTVNLPVKWQQLVFWPYLTPQSSNRFEIFTAHRELNLEQTFSLWNKQIQCISWSKLGCKLYQFLEDPTKQVHESLQPRELKFLYIRSTLVTFKNQSFVA